MSAHLFVDESGDFSTRADSVVAGGPLLRGDLPDLRARLESAMPGFPWPLHAAHVNRPVVWALSAYLASESDGPQDVVIRDTLTELRRLANPLLHTALQSLRAGRWPTVPNLQALDAAMWDARPELMRDLANRIQRARACVARLGGSLTEQHGVVMAAEAGWAGVDVERARPRTGHEETDRYYDVLLAAIERARAVAAEATCAHLLVTVLTRPVFDPVEGHFRGLRKDDVQSLISGLPPSTCLVDVQPIAAWNADVPSACVVADLCCNAARRVLTDPVLSLKLAEQRLQGACGFSLRSGRPPRTHLGAAFPAGRGPWLERADANVWPPAVAPVGIRQWAWEQAMEWLEQVPK